MKTAYLFKKIKDNVVQCETCVHKCIIQNNKRGMCGVRENQNGILKALNYSKAIVAHIDPIEKKPFFHFLPGSYSCSIATVGCNFRCQHCQNYDISQYTKDAWDGEIIGQRLKPNQIIKQAIDNDCQSIAFTYTEPTVFLEYAYETMRLAKQNGLKNVWVSNGYMSKETLELIIPYLDAINIDLKSFNEKFYSQVCGAKLQPILDNLISIKNSRVHLEITTLIIPTQNDSPKELNDIAKFIKHKLGSGVPWHVSAFYPAFKMRQLPATPKEKILEAAKIGHKAGLKYVYAGNI